MPVPESVQATYTPKPRLRGILPVPREIFPPKKGGESRFDDAYFAKLTRARQRRGKPSPSDPQTPRIEWKARMAAKRRENLSQGISDLRAQQERRREAKKLGDAIRSIANEREIEAREARQDIRLTNPTTVQAMQPLTSPFRAARQADKDALRRRLAEQRETLPPLEYDRLRTRERNALRKKWNERKAKGQVEMPSGLPDPNREARQAGMRARVEEKEARRVADRQDALHTLYMHARTFITNETQLDAAIDKAFGTPQQPVEFGYHGMSVWNTGPSEKGPFQGVHDKLDQANRARGTFADKQGFADLTNERLKRIAEELTGGKM